MPGVLVIEALAQCGAILALREIADSRSEVGAFHEHQGKRAFGGRSFRATRSFWKSRRSASARAFNAMRGEAKVDGQLCADAELMSVIADRKNTPQ